MKISLSQLSGKFTLEKALIYVLIFAVLFTFVFVFYLFFLQFVKKIEIVNPNGGDEWEIGQTYEITWKARGVNSIGIVMFKGKNPQWVVKNINAGDGKYPFKVYPDQSPYGDDYWFAIFEYPWKQGNRIDYSDSSFAVVYPEHGSCEQISTENEWPYLASDLPNLRKVFLTADSYSGNLGGLKGADEKCQQEAQRMGFSGKWVAFIGGDSVQEEAVARFSQTAQKTNGIFIEAKVSDTLIRGATCHRLLAKNINEFLRKLSNLSIINQEKLDADFLNEFGNIWLGRIDSSSRENCASIASVYAQTSVPLAEKFSFTTTCQNWTQDGMYVQGYPVPPRTSKPQFPNCYTPQGKATDSVALGGLSTGLVGAGIDSAFTPYEGKYCNSRQKILCVED